MQPSQSDDPTALEILLRENKLVVTPCKTIQGEGHSTCYDDIYMFRLSKLTGGCIISNDKFEDLQRKVPGKTMILLSLFLVYITIFTFFDFQIGYRFINIVRLVSVGAMTNSCHQRIQMENTDQASNVFYII